jgi:hypothetical protein
MKHFLNLILPEKLEVLLWLALGLIALIVLNVGRFTSWVTNSPGMPSVDIIGKYLRRLDDFLDPRLIDFFVWVLAGIAVFLLFSVIIALFKTAGDEVSTIRYYKSPVGRYHEIMVFLTKSAIRLFGFICVIFWLNLFTKSINPILSDLFYESVTTFFKSTFVWFSVIFAVVTYSAYLYLLAIISRILVLRIRVFGNRQEEFGSHNISA